MSSRKKCGCILKQITEGIPIKTVGKITEEAVEELLEELSENSEKKKLLHEEYPGVNLEKVTRGNCSENS